MNTELATPKKGSDLETNRKAEARTFGIIDLAGVTIPDLIEAVVTNDASAIKWPEGTEGAEQAILERLASAESTEAVFGEQQATGWAELLTVPVEVHGFRLLPSTMENGVCFAVVDVYRLDEGERTVVTTSSRGVLVQLLQGVLLGAVPGVFRLTEVGEAKKGRSAPQRLVRMGDLTTSALADSAA